MIDHDEIVKALRIARSLARRYRAVIEYDDAYQEACLGLVLAAYKYEPGRAGYATFAGHCARTQLLAHLDREIKREQKHRPLDDARYEAASEPPRDTIALKKINSTNLNEREKDLIERYFFRDQTIIEIAEETAVSKQAVWAMIERAVAKIQKKMKGKNP